MSGFVKESCIGPKLAEGVLNAVGLGSVMAPPSRFGDFWRGDTTWFAKECCAFEIAACVDKSRYESSSFVGLLESVGFRDGPEGRAPSWAESIETR